MTKDTDFIIEQFAYAVARYIDAKRDEEKAREQYDGSSWGYYGQSYFEAIERAKTELTDTFTKAVKAVVKAGKV